MVNSVRQHTCFITQGNYIGYSHLQAYSLQVKAQDAVRTQPVQNRPENDCLIVEICSLHITLCNKNSCADVRH